MTKIEENTALVANSDAVATVEHRIQRCQFNSTLCICMKTNGQSIITFKLVGS